MPHASGTARRFETRIGLTRPASAQTVPPGLTTAGSTAARLFATGKDPITCAADEVRGALLACEDAAAAVEHLDSDLFEAFGYARTQLDLAARMTADTRIPDLATYTRLLPGVLGTQSAVAGAPRLSEPVAASRETLYGLRATLSGALAFLAEAVRRLGAIPRRDALANSVLPIVGLVAVAASRVAHVADVVVAHHVVSTRPTPPELPGVGGDVELYAAGRAAPYRRAAMRARVRFTPGRVEITTASGRVSIGQDHPIGMLLWVAPGVTSAFEGVMDPREQDAPTPELDELGTVHVLDTAGRSLASLAVADWASQATTVVDQSLVDATFGDTPLGAARGVGAIEALGFARGATTIGVPLRRGLAHPPEAEGSLGLLRPAPQRLAYQGEAARPVPFGRRRGARRRFWNLDLGPTLRFSRYTRAALPWFVGLAPLVIWPGGGRYPFQIAWLVVTFALMLEPYAIWLWALARDQTIPVRASARYRAGAGPFAPRLELRGRDLVLTSRSGHRTRLPGPTDGDLGIVRIARLGWQGTTWGFALADARWRWRVVLPAHEWAGGGTANLEAFAREVGLTLADHEVAPLPRLGQETVAPGPTAAWRTLGPSVRGLLVHGIVLVPAALLSLLGPTRSVWVSLALAALTFGGAGVLALLARLRLLGPVQR